MTARVLYILPSYPCWSETFLHQDLRLLMARGVPLTAVALARGPEGPGTEPLPVTVLRPGAQQEQGLPDRLQPLTALLPRSLRVVLSLVRNRDLRACLDHQVTQSGATHLHAEFADLPALLAARVARRRSLGFSVGAHARDVFACRFPARSLFLGARMVTVCNRAAELELRPRLERISGPVPVLLHHGLCLDEWSWQGPRSPEPGPYRILFVGRMVAKKGVDLLLGAVARLHTGRHGSCSLTLVGDGPARPALERLAAELGILEQLHWEGVLSRGAVRRTMEQADLLAVPSRVPPDGDRDGIPNVVVEAMALGLPVVASCAGGLPEVVTPETGRPCPETSPEALARVILEARADPDENARRARQARCLVEREFDACRNSDLRAELFRQLLSQQES